MNEIHFSPEALNDLVKIKEYIEEDLLNPSAAVETINKITKSLRILETFPHSGPLLSSIADVNSDYRFVISGNYISFYRVNNDEVYVDRILYSHRDYIRILFGDNV